jgi:hypothetical protein
MAGRVNRMAVARQAPVTDLDNFPSGPPVGRSCSESAMGTPSTAAMGTPSTAYPSAKAIAELAREAQLQQLQGLDSLDTKSASLIGLSGVLLGLIFTSSVAIDRWSLSLSIGAGLIGVSIVFLALGLLPRTSRFNPNILALAPA